MKLGHNNVIGQQYVKRGNRLFAVPRPQGIADRIAAQSNVRGNWGKVMTHNRRARVIANTHAG